MNAQDLTLNIAVNLGRLCRWAMEGRMARVEQFLAETETYVQELDAAPKSFRFQATYESFKKDFGRLRREPKADAEWAEEVLTWANILSHRAKLA